MNEQVTLTATEVAQIRRRMHLASLALKGNNKAAEQLRLAMVLLSRAARRKPRKINRLLMQEEIINEIIK